MRGFSRHFESQAFLFMAIAIFVSLIGCSSSSKQLVGTWQGDIQARSTRPYSEGILRLKNPMTLEFAENGKYRLSLGNETGTYSIKGKEVTLTPDTKTPDNTKVLSLSDDGKTLQDVESSNDVVIESKKQK